MKAYKHILILVFVCISAFSSAQIHSVQAKIDSTTLLIGQQTQIHLEVVQQADANVQFPIIADSIKGGLEVVNRSKLDTTKLEDGNLKINSSITVTAFDSALYYIPSFVFSSGNDTVFTNPLTLKVLPVAVDTANAKIYDIKPIYDAPIDWVYVAMVVGIILLVIGIGVFAFILIRKYLKDKNQSEEEEEVIIVNPFEHAMTELERIRNEKIWQQGKVKDFYTELTDVLREYIELRYHISALEMTSDEVLSMIKSGKILDSEQEQILSQVLKLADLVKFAKWTPELKENDQSLENAVLFVEKTKPVEEVVEEKEESENVSVDDNA